MPKNKGKKVDKPFTEDLKPLLLETLFGEHTELLSPTYDVVAKRIKLDDRLEICD